MTRMELLQLLLAQARSNGFQFRRWYVGWLGLPWESPQKAAEVLSEGRRYYALLFSSTFAESFWKSGSEMTLQMPSQTFQRRMSNGTIGTVVRKGFTRRRTRPDAWRYHLRQMAVAEDPLRYIRRFLRVIDDLEIEPGPVQPAQSATISDPRFIVDEEDLLTD
jgi:hypothetical protein